MKRKIMINGVKGKYMNGNWNNYHSPYTKRLQFIFREIKNVQSSESPSEFLWNTASPAPLSKPL